MPFSRSRSRRIEMRHPPCTETILRG